MLYRNITFLRFAVIAAVASMAYSGNSSVTLADQPVPGSYELSFFTEDFVQLSSLPACTPSPGVSCPDLVLGAHITDNAGLPAQGGSVTFQICVIAGAHVGDLHRHWAPSAECDNGPGAWGPWAEILNSTNREMLSQALESLSIPVPSASVSAIPGKGAASLMA